MRREWRSLAIALVATVVVVGVSFVLAPWLWSDFIEASRTQVDATVNVPRQAAPIALPLRLVVAAVLVAWAGAHRPRLGRADRARARRAVPVVERVRGDGRGGAALRVAAGRREGDAATEPDGAAAPIPAHTG